MVIFNRNRCYNGGKGHLFIAVYDEEPTNISLNTALLELGFKDGETIDFYTASELKKILHVKVYVCSFCKWCGKIVKRNQDELNVRNIRG